MSKPEENREHPALLVLYLLSFGTPLLLWAKAPVVAQIGGWIGAASLALLLGRWVLVGFTGYERRVGLRIIRRTQAWKRGRFWLVLAWSMAVLGAAALLAFNHVIDRDDAALLELLQPLRVCLVFLVAAATFMGLLLAIAQRFTVFATTSIMGVVLGVAALLVIQSVATGVQHEFERRVVGVYAHINVTRGIGLSEHRRFEAWLRTLDGVEGVSPYVYYAMALAPQRVADDGRELRRANVMVKGIEPPTAAQVLDLAQHLEQGSGRAIPLTELRSDYALMPVPDRDDGELPPVIAQTPDPRGDDWYEAAIRDWQAVTHDDPFRVGRSRFADEDWEDPPDELGATAKPEELDRSAMPTMFIGVGLARALQLAEGDVVRLVDPGASFGASFGSSEQPKFVTFVIAGVFQAGFHEYDSQLVYVDIKELQRVRYGGKDLVSGLDLRLADRQHAPEVGALVREALNGPEGTEYTVLEWQKLNAQLFKSISSSGSIITVVLSLVIFVASFNVLSVLWTMVVRRTPEIAILMSMGATGPEVARIFQVTGTTIGLVGALAGSVFGLVVCWLIELYGYTLDSDVYLIDKLSVEVSVVQIAWILAATLAACFVATIPPSLRAAQQRPVDGLKYE